MPGLIRVDTTNPPGRETAAAVLLRDHLEAAGVELRAGGPRPGPGQPGRAHPGHRRRPVAGLRRAHRRGAGRPARLDAPAVRRRSSTDGYLYGRGAVDMKNEVAARVVAMARLARSGFRPRGDLWLLAVADEEDGSADVGMRWLLEHRPDIRPDFALNEGEGCALELADGRAVMGIAVGDKGTYPGAGHRDRRGGARLDARARAATRCRCWPSCCAGSGSGLPDPQPSPVVDRMVRGAHRWAVPDDADGYAGAVADRRSHAPGARAPRPGRRRDHDGADDAHRVEQAQRDAGPGQRRARLPDPARHHRGRRRARGARAARRRHPLRAGLAGAARRGQQLARGRAAVRRLPGVPRHGRPGHGAAARRCRPASPTRSTCARPAAPSPTASARCWRRRADVALAGFHAKDERVHVDDLPLAVQFHEQAARALLG